MDVYLASDDVSDNPVTRRKSAGKVVAAHGGVGLVMLRLRHLAGGVTPSDVRLVASDNDRPGSPDIPVRVEVPEWWRPEWITDGCQ